MDGLPAKSADAASGSHGLMRVLLRANQAWHCLADLQINTMCGERVRRPVREPAAWRNEKMSLDSTGIGQTSHSC
jgi:hypothetical protein